MKKKISFWIFILILFSCGNDDNLSLEECPEASRIEINSDSETINYADIHDCINWNEGDHDSAMFFTSNRINLIFGCVSYFSIRTSSKEQGIYSIANYLDNDNESVSAGTGVAVIQIYEDSIVGSPEEHYAMNSGVINVWEKENGEIIKCIKDGRFTSISDPTRSITASISIVCDK